MQDPIKLPGHLVQEFSTKPMAIVNYVVDIVGIDEDGEEFQVPLYDGYNHHYAIGIGR